MISPMNRKGRAYIARRSDKGPGRKEKGHDGSGRDLRRDIKR